MIQSVGEWGWKDVQDTNMRARAMLGQLDHKASVIVDLTQSPPAEASYLFHLGFVPDGPPPDNLDKLVFVSPLPYIYAWIDLLREQHNSESSHIYFRKTREEAEALLDEASVDDTKAAD